MESRESTRWTKRNRGRWREGGCVIIKGEVRGRRCVAAVGGGGRLQFSVWEVFNWRVTLEDRLISASPSITRGQETPGVTWPTPRSHRIPRPAEGFNHHAAIMSHLAVLLSAPPCSHTIKENGDTAQQLRTTINSDLQGQSGGLIMCCISA